MIYKFANLHFTHNGKQYLASGQATYSVDDFGDDEKEAGFDDAALDEVIGATGKMPELTEYKDSVVVALNRNESLCRMLAL